MKRLLTLAGIVCLFASLVLAGEAAITEKKMEPFAFACMHHTGPFEQMTKAVEVFMKEFFGQKLMPTGPLMGIYYNSPDMVKPEELKWAVGFPVADGIKVKDPLKLDHFKHELVLYHLYKGPYEGMDKAYKAIEAYMKKNNYKWDGPAYERWLDNPQETKPENLRTEILVPVKKCIGEMAKPKQVKPIKPKKLEVQPAPETETKPAPEKPQEPK